MWIKFLKYFLNFTILFMWFFFFFFFGWEAYRILASWSGIKDAHPTLKGKVLTTSLSGKSHHYWVFFTLQAQFNPVKWSEVKWSEVTQSCPTLCDPMDYSLPASLVHGIFQARVLEWVAISFSRGYFQSRNWTWVSRTAGRRFTVWATDPVKVP